MELKFKHYSKLLLIGMLWVACKQEHKTNADQADQEAASAETTHIPVFNGDTAMQFVLTQLNFGPRVPSTTAHANCVEWLKQKLEQYKAEVQIQSAQVSTFDGKKHTLKNIIASFNPNVKQRVVLAAHYDTRPFADQDPKDKVGPIEGANDGASGVAVLLEIARLLQNDTNKLGVDIVLFDIEDYGQPDGTPNPKADTYCIGSQFWAKQPHKSGYNATYGILLDMVGAPDATFYLEGHSMQYAGSYAKALWSTAQQLGYSNYFIAQQGNPIIDDHYYVNTILGIPMVDIIHCTPTTPSGFGAYWHTHSDTKAVVSPNTLKAVGQTVITFLFQEKI